MQVIRNIQQMVPPPPLPSSLSRRDPTGERAREPLAPVGRAAESAWPSVPLAAGRSLSRDQMGRVMLAILGSEAIVGAAPDAGLTLARMKHAMKDARVDDSTIGRAAGAVCVWLAHAGILAESSSAQPWAEPRPLRLRDADALQAHLRATPPPDPADVHAERERGLH